MTDKPKYFIRGSVDLYEAFKDIPPGSRLIGITIPPKNEKRQEQNVPAVRPSGA